MEISRRNALVVIPAAIASATPALVRTARAGDARLLQLERRWERLRQMANTRGISDERCDRIVDLMNAVDDRMLRIPANGPDGLMVKFRRLQYWSDLQFNARLRDTCDAFEADLVRLAGAS